MFAILYSNSLIDYYTSSKLTGMLCFLPSALCGCLLYTATEHTPLNNPNVKLIPFFVFCMKYNVYILQSEEDQNRTRTGFGVFIQNFFSTIIQSIQDRTGR